MASKAKTKLLISNLAIKDFRAYGGNDEISLELSDDPKRTITIIHGEMGKGKTTILDAIYWCLYGEERSKKGTMQTGEGLVNTNAISKMKVGDKNETYVEIILHDEEGIRFKIKRGISFTKDLDSLDRKYDPIVKAIVPVGFSFKEYAEFHYLNPRGRDVDWEVSTKPEIVNEKIEKLFPNILSSYFLFDAELLNDFFLQRADEHVRNGIEQISGMPLMESLRDNLKKSSGEIERQIADSDVSTKPIAEEMQQYQQELAKLTENLSANNDRLEEIKNEKKGLQDYLRQHDDQEIQNLQGQVDDFNSELSRLSNEIDKKEEQIRNFLISWLPKLLLRNTIVSAETMFQHHEDEGHIPPTIAKIALDNILTGKSPTCICGTPVHEGSKEREILEKLRSRVVDSALTQQITVGRTLLSEAVNFTDPIKLSGLFGTMRSERGQLTTLHSEKKTKKNSLQQKLDNHNIEEVQEKARQLHQLEQEEIKLIGANQLNKEKIGFGERHLQDLEKKLEVATGKSNKYKTEKNKAKLAKIIASIIEQSRKEIIDDMRATTARLTTKYFLSLVSKKSDFSNVDILPSYQTVAYDNNKQSKSLSAGQSCCLALSYIAAIREIANRDYFMMIDSPLHNISSEERVDVARSLPGYIPGTQITLLVQDQEYTGSANKKITGDKIPSVRDTLQANHTVWREYLLETSKGEGDISSNSKAVLLSDFSKGG